MACGFSNCAWAEDARELPGHSLQPQTGARRRKGGRDVFYGDVGGPSLSLRESDMLMRSGVVAAPISRFRTSIQRNPMI